jgi:RHS repeat-associated protein
MITYDHVWYPVNGYKAATSLRFAGQYEDHETGLACNGFRYYDPDTGRYLSPDPIGLLGGLNAFAYVPNPFTWIDPEGLAQTKAQKAAQLIKNKAAGDAAEKQTVAELRKRGHDVQEQSGIRICKGKGGLRKVDALVTLNSDEPQIGKKGQTVAVEVKSGNATRTTQQEKNDNLIAGGTGTHVGKNAPPGKKGQPVGSGSGIPTVVVPVPPGI